MPRYLVCIVAVLAGLPGCRPSCDLVQALKQAAGAGAQDCGHETSLLDPGFGSSVQRCMGLAHETGRPYFGYYQDSQGTHVEADGFASDGKHDWDYLYDSGDGDPRLFRVQASAPREGDPVTFGQPPPTIVAPVQVCP